MKQTYIVYGIVIFGLIMSFTLPRITTIAFDNGDKSVTYTSQKTTEMASSKGKVESTQKLVDKTSNVDLAIATPEVKEVKEEPKEEVTTPAAEPVQQPTVLALAKPYGEMTIDELIAAIANGSFTLEYSKVYDTNTNGLTKSRGALYYEDHKETYYSQRVLPGNSLNIPGRHVADDGTVRDGDGYICVAANTSYKARGEVVKTSLGPAKVYD